MQDSSVGFGFESRMVSSVLYSNLLLSCNFWLFFLAFDFCRFFIPATTANDLWLRRIFFPRFYPLHFFPYLNSWERASIFPFECSGLNKGTTGTIFIPSLVWCGPWLGIEPGTSRTRSQHYTTRLSRRRYATSDKCEGFVSLICSIDIFKK